MSLIQQSDSIGNEDDGYYCILYKRGFVEKVGVIEYKKGKRVTVSIDNKVSYHELQEILEMLRTYPTNISNTIAARKAEYSKGFK